MNHSMCMQSDLRKRAPHPSTHTRPPHTAHNRPPPFPHPSGHAHRHRRITPHPHPHPPSAPRAGGATLGMMFFGRWVFQNWGWGPAAMITPTVGSLLITP